MLVIALFVAVPTAVSLLIIFPKFQKWGIFLAMTFFIMTPKLWIQYFADHAYVKGTSQSFEICFLDFFVLIYLIVLLAKSDYKFKFFPPGTIFFFIFFAICLISCKNAPVGLYSAFEIYKFVKMFSLFVVMYNILLCYNCYDTVINGFACGIFINFLYALYQKYALGGYLIAGFMPHKNNAGMYLNVLMPVYLYIALNLKFKSQYKRFFYVAAFVASSGTIVFTQSRAAWGISALILFLIFSISMYRGVTRDKIIAICLLFVVLSLGLVKAYNTMYKRISVGNEAGTVGRKLLVENAVDMANKNFWGVGINNYTAVNTIENNYGDIFYKYANLSPDRNLGKVETVYLLTAAECGWIGLAAMLMWFFYYLIQGFISCFYYWKTNMSYLSIGITIGLLGAYLHSTLEWSLRFSQSFYLLMAVFAIIASLVYHRRHDTLRLRGK